MGTGTSVILPVDQLGRNYTVPDPVTALNNNAYSMGMWLFEDVLANRQQLAMANLINQANTTVSPNTESLLSAINDFTGSNVSNLVNGESFP